MSNAVFRSVVLKVSKWKGRNKRLVSLGGQVSRKLAASPIESGRLRAHVSAMQRMVIAYVRGQYSFIPWKNLTLVIAGLLYFIDPFDLVPDFIPVGGMLDDAAVLMWIVGLVGAELERFINWEKTISPES